MNMTKGQGFTLIELLVVVSIISILAAIAVPAFNEYVVKSKVTEALLASVSSRKNVEEYYAYHGVLPRNNAEAGLSTANMIKGNYFSSLTVVDGSVVIHFDERSGKSLDGRTLTLKPEINSNFPLQVTGWYCADKCRPSLADKSKDHDKKTDDKEL